MSQEAPKVPKVNQELQKQYDAFKSTLAQLQQKIVEMESEADEYKQVLETLKGTDKSRKCHRMIGGVLVEKTVGEVTPVLETNLSGIKTVLESMTKDYQKTDKEMAEWQKKNKVQIMRTG
ncbi:prefoldin subunit 2 [Trichomonascus vanleenenianus]|uniref:tubulin-binding prefolding complex subunit GIM4 n=1 Tax=Trichomonascus vanleenenianus TaxID=2268995 RepID=UPI003ECB2873